MDFSEYYKKIMAAEKVADETDELFGNKPRPEFHHPFGGHHGHGPAPVTTVYHHHHGKVVATETPTITVTSNATLTCLVLATSTDAASAPADFIDTTETPIESSFEGVLEYVASIRVWALTFLLIFNALSLVGMLEPSQPKTKSSTRPKQLTRSLAGIELDLACLKP